MAAVLQIVIRAKDEASSVLQGVSQQAGMTDSDFNKMKVGMVAAGAGIAAGLGLSAASAMNFQQAITNAASVTGYMGEEADNAKAQMESLARQLAAESRYTPEDVANAMYDLASKGFEPAKMSAGELMPFLSLAAATQSDLASTTEIVTSSINQFTLGTDQAQRVSDVFSKTIGSSAATMEKLRYSMTYVGPLASKMGMSIEETSATLGALYDAGLDGSMAGTALRGVLAELLTPGNDLQAVMDRLGLAEEDVSVESHGLTGALRNLINAGMTTSEAMDVFGKRAGISALTLMGLNREGRPVVDVIDELSGELEHAEGTSLRMMNMQLDTTKGGLEILKSKLQEFMIGIGENLTPVIENVTAVLQKMFDIFNDLPGPVKTAVTWIAAFGAAALITGGSVGVLTWGMKSCYMGLLTLVTGLKAAKGAMLAFYGVAAPVAAPVAAIAAAVALVVGQAALLWKYWDDIPDWAKAILLIYNPIARIVAIIKNWNTILGVLKKAWSFIVDKFQRGFEAIRRGFRVVSDAVGTVASNIRNFFQPVFDFIRNRLNELYNVFRTIFDAISAVVRAVWNVITQTARVAFEVLCAIWSPIQAFFELIWSIVSQIFDVAWTLITTAAQIAYDAVTAIWGALVDFFQGIWDLVVGIFEAIWSVLEGPIRAVWDAFVGVWDAIVQYFTDLWDSVKGVFEKVWNDYLKAPVEAVVQSVKDTFNTITNWFKTLFTNIKNVFKRLWEDYIKGPIETVCGAIQGAFETVVDNICEFFKGIPTALKGVFNSVFDALRGWSWTLPSIKIAGKKIGGQTFEPFKNLPSLAEGGLVVKPTIAMLGERPEAIIPLHKMPHLGGDIHVHIGIMTGDRLAAARLVDLIQRELRKRQRHSVGEAIY